MIPGTTSITGLFQWGSHQAVLRSISALVIKRHNSTMAASQVLQDEWNNAKPYENIPGPKPLPVIGNIWRFLPYIGELAMDFSDQQPYFHKKYGNIMRLSGIPGHNDAVFLYEPDDIEKVYRNEGPWPIRNAFNTIAYYRTVMRKDIFKEVGGAIVNQGEEWQKFRSKVNQPMMQPKTTKMYVGPIDEVASDFIQRIRFLRDKNMEMPENFHNDLYRWGLESIVFIALDTRMGCLNNELNPDSEPQKMINAVQVIFDTIFKLDLSLSFWKVISTPAWRSFVRASDFFTEVSMKYINQAINRMKTMPEDTDKEMTVLEKILARDPNPKTAMVMALDMMFAGVDTTSYSTAVLLYFLAKNPDKQQKLFQEVLQHVPSKEQPITSNILNELKYLKACIKESMRLRPIAIGNTRTLVKDMVLHNYRVPKGTDVVMPNMYLCGMEKYFSQPEKYLPERWLKSGDGDPAESKMAHPFVYMPFGFGPRMCLGRRFAELEIETLITKIIRNFHVEYNYGEMEFRTTLLHAPISPLKFKFGDRE